MCANIRSTKLFQIAVLSHFLSAVCFVCLFVCLFALFHDDCFCLSIGFPAIVVAISLAATQTDGYGTEATCWLDVSSGLIWAFIAPAITVISVSEKSIKNT